MKKIRVYQLAKKKKISSKELIEILKKKGLKKLVAQSMVDPAILDEPKVAAKPSPKVKPKPKPEAKVEPREQPKVAAKPVPAIKSGNVAHITSAPSHWGSGSTAKAPAPAQAVVAEKRKLEEKQKTEAPPKQKVKQDPTKKEPEKKIAKLNLITAVASIIALIVAGLAFTAVQSDKVALKELSSGIDQLQASITANKTEMEKLSGKIDATEKNMLTSQLKSEADVIRSLSSKLDEPLKIKANALADKLSSF